MLLLLNMAALTFLNPPAGPPPKAPIDESEPTLNQTNVVFNNTPTAKEDGLLNEGALTYLNSKAGSSTQAPNAEPTAEPNTTPSTEPGPEREPTTIKTNEAFISTPTATEDEIRIDVPKTSGKPNEAVMSFDPVTLAFDDIHYYVPSPTGSGELELLKGITGVFRPGVLTALMGASGAGKSTLMDVLTGRKTVGRITGKVTVNGHDKDDATFARISGYCEQFDSHAPGTSVCFLPPVLG